MRRFFTKFGRPLAAIAFLMVVSTAIGLYISVHQNLRIPFQARYTLKAEFATTNGLTPGLAQPVNVAGVRVGTITNAELKNGRSVVTMDIDPGKLKHVYGDAHAVLRPNTALKDIQVELFPGRPPAKPLPGGATIPVARTTPPIDSDELTAALDLDTRDFFDILVGSGDEGIRNRGEDLRKLLKALGPTAAQTKPIGDALVARRVELKRLVHNLAVLSKAVGSKDKQLADLVRAANATVGALASQEVALRGSIARLPGTLSKARSTLHHSIGFANELGPTLTALQPTAEKLPATLKAVDPLVKEAEPIVRKQLRPFVKAGLPVARDLAPTTRDLTTITPHLTTVFHVLTYIANELAYNAPGDDEGYLFWLAWFAHNGMSASSTEDAHGAVARGMGMFSCDSFVQNPQLAPVLQIIAGPLSSC